MSSLRPVVLPRARIATLWHNGPHPVSRTEVNIRHSGHPVRLMTCGVTEQVFLELLSCEYENINKTHHNIVTAYFLYAINDGYRATESCCFFL